MMSIIILNTHIQDATFDSDPLAFCGEPSSQNKIILSDKLTISELQKNFRKYDPECVNRLVQSFLFKMINET
ncbi:hypothetical protein LCGC14_0175680 [marine sediment metagenome]|uniref:Uncharacterized protein n=1 Tax=marine sediment metagenome TaxID=412755 RepID=A0A0F9UVD3_9ZZZZ